MNNQNKNQNSTDSTKQQDCGGKQSQNQNSQQSR